MLLGRPRLERVAGEMALGQIGVGLLVVGTQQLLLEHLQRKTAYDTINGGGFEPGQLFPSQFV